MKKLFSINVIFLLLLLNGIITSINDETKQETSTVEVASAISSHKSNTAITRWYANAPKAQINFAVDGPFGKVHGKLSDLKSTIQFDENNLAASSLKASVDPKSIKTGIGLRNRDLQKEKFLDSDNHPLISFQSNKIIKSGTSYKAIGGLTIKGVTRTVEIPFTFTEKANSGVFKGAFTIHREDFGVGKKGGTVGNEIDITLEVPVIKPK